MVGRSTVKAYGLSLGDFAAISSLQFLQSLVQFFVSGSSGNIMPHDAAKRMRFGRWEFPQHILHHGPAYRRKRIPVIETKRRKFVATPTNLDRLPKGHPDLMSF
jgi:hypothetical protein